MEYKIENEFLEAVVCSKGCELVSVKTKKDVPARFCTGYGICTGVKDERFDCDEFNRYQGNT